MYNVLEPRRSRSREIGFRFKDVPELDAIRRRCPWPLHDPTLDGIHE